MKWSELELARVAKMYRAGHTTQQIVDATGRTWGSVASAIHRHSKKGTGKGPKAEKAWRIQQLVTAGYSEAEIAHIWGIAA